MQTTSSKTGVPFTLRAGRKVRIGVAFGIGKGAVDVVAGLVGAGFTTWRVNGAAKEFGPFSDDVVLNIRALSGAVTYNEVSEQGGLGLVAFGDSLTHHVFPQNRIQSLKRVSGIATIVLETEPNFYWKGCPIDVVGVPADFAGHRFITGGGGTSGTAAARTWTYESPGPDVESAALGSNSYAANMSSYSDVGFLTWAQILSNQRYDLLRVFAGTGRTSAEILASMDEGGLTMGAAAYIICSGKNDQMGGADPLVTIANIEAKYQKALDAGGIVFAVTLPPLGAAAWTAARARFDQVVNDWIRAKARTTENVILCDIYQALVNPTAANKGEGKANFLSAVDGAHLPQRGAHAAGKVIAAAMQQAAPFADFRAASNADTYATNAGSRVLASGYWTNTGGSVNAAVAGVAPAGISVLRNGSANVTYSAPARADGIGYDLVAAVTATGSGDGSRVHGDSPALASMPANTVLQTDISVAVAGVAGSNLQSVTHYLSMLIDGQTATIGALISGGSTGQSCVQEDWSGILRSPRVRLPVQPSQVIYPRTDTSCGAAGTQFTFSVGRSEIAKA